MSRKVKLFALVRERVPESKMRQLEKLGVIRLDEESLLVPLEALEDFERVMERTYRLGEKDLERLVSLIAKADTPVVVESVGAYRGASSYGVEVRPERGAYVVRIIGTGEEHRVPSSIVHAYTQVVSTLKRLGVRTVRKRELVKMALREAGLVHLFEKDGSFCWEAFYGDRKHYHLFYYYPIKVVEKWGLVRVLPNDRVEIPP